MDGLVLDVILRFSEGFRALNKHGQERYVQPLAYFTSG